MDAGASYVFEAYSDSTCTTANRLATAEIFTTYVSVNNLYEAGTGFFNIGTAVGSNSVNHHYSTQFTTGGASAGYALKAVEAEFATDYGSPPDIRVRIYTNNANNLPWTSRVTLTGSNPNTFGIYTYACPGGDSCELNASTKYHIALELASDADAGSYYQWGKSSSDNQTLNPLGNGWEIGDSSGRHSAAGGWTAAPGSDSGRFSVIASVNPTLSASNVTATSAKLTLNSPQGKWHYKQTAPSAGTCSDAHNRTTTDAITNLAPGVEYTYKAYSDSACSTEIAAVTLTMPTLAASNITDDGATLTLGGSYTGNWYHKQTAPSGGTCSSTVSGTIDNITGLDAGASYVFEAYSDSGCTPANRLAIADIFTTYISVSNTSATFASNSFNVGREDNSSETHYYATPFRTGGASAGYTLKRVNASFSDGVGSPPKNRVRILPQRRDQSAGESESSHAKTGAIPPAKPTMLTPVPAAKAAAR